MSKIFRLARQRLRSDWKIHLAALLLTCLTSSAFLIYQSYMEQVGLSYSRQTSELHLLADFQIELPNREVITAAIEPTGSWKTRPTPQLKVSARALDLNSGYGHIQVLVLQPENDYTGPLPQPGQILINERFAAAFGLPTQGDLTLSGTELTAPLTLAIGGTFDSSSVTGHMLLHQQDVQPLLRASGYNVFLYDLPEQLALQPAIAALERFYPNSLLLTAQQAQQVAQQAVRDTYQGFGNLVLLIFVFLTLGVLTALLLSFMDSKRELSVLKSLGLMPRELAALFLINGVATALAGLATGIGLAYLVSAVMQTRGVLLTIAPQQILSLSWRVVLAYTLAILVPVGLAQRATVNQLLYDQPIPLRSYQVNTLKRNRRIFDEELARGWQIMQLPVIDGVLEGFIFKEEGNRVKVGEVIGFSSGWWGMTYTEYVATIDGEVDRWQEDSGIIAIKPPESE